MSKAGKNMTKLEAVEYLKEVQKKFKDEKEKFEEFLKIMTDYRLHRLDQVEPHFFLQFPMHFSISSIFLEHIDLLHLIHL